MNKTGHDSGPEPCVRRSDSGIDLYLLKKNRNDSGQNHSLCLQFLAALRSNGYQQLPSENQFPLARSDGEPISRADDGARGSVLLFPVHEVSADITF